MHPALEVLLIGLIYLAGFSGLSFVRRQGFSLRFTLETGAVAAAGILLALAAVPLHPLLFLVILYLATMRVRLLADLGTWHSNHGRHERGLAVFRLALSLGPDPAGRQIVLINRGVAELRMKQPEAAYRTLQEVLDGEPADARNLGVKYAAAGLYNLGLACRRTGRPAEAERCFRQAMAMLPGSLYAQAAAKALEELSAAGR
jgi:tetratricopeptide (TPR) repeat protein